MSSNRSDLQSSPVIAVAAARPVTRRRRHGGEPPLADTGNNYVANSRATIGDNSGNRRRPGAPLGNRNAQTHGGYSADGLRDFLIWERNIRRRVKLLLALRKLAVRAAREAAL